MVELKASVIRTLSREGSSIYRLLQPFFEHDSHKGGEMVKACLTVPC